MIKKLPDAAQELATEIITDVSNRDYSAACTAYSKLQKTGVLNNV